MRILITGCNGQLGNEMQLLEKENPQHSYFNTDVAELDITDEAAIVKFVEDNEIDGIVNCAAYTAVDKAEDNQELCRKLNTVAPGYLAAAVEKRGGWMIQISTDYVFDGTNHTPYTEDEPTCPNSVYGSTKLEGEQAAQKGCKRTMIIRTAWLYSTFGNNFVKTMIRLGKEKPELGVIFDQIGTPTYARDLAVAIFAAINQGEAKSSPARIDGLNNAIRLTDVCLIATTYRDLSISRSIIDVDCVVDINTNLHHVARFDRGTRQVGG